MAIVYDFDLYDYDKAKLLPTVKNAKITVQGDELIIPEDGLFSESIFGPIKNYKCKCGYVTTWASRGIRCPICSVLCDSKTLRNETFAKIDLPFNMFIIQPFLIPNLMKIFGKEQIKNILKVSQYDSNKKTPYLFSISRGKLIKINKLKKEEMVIEEPVYDITSLHRLWRYLMKNEILKSKFILPHSPNEKINKIIFTNHIPVTPPNSRPIIPIGKGKWNVSDISKLYSKLLKSLGSSQTFSDDLFMHNEILWGSTIYRYQYIWNKIHELIHEKGFKGKFSMFRGSMTGKTVEFSARQVIVPNPAIKPYGLGVHEKVIKDFYYLDIINFIDKKYDSRDENNNIMNFVHNIERDIKMGNTINFSDKDFFEFLETTGLKDAKMIMERPPVLYKYNTSGLYIDSVILESNLKRNISITKNKENNNDQKFDIEILEEPVNMLMYKMTNLPEATEIAHNYITLRNNFTNEDKIDGN